MKRIGGRKLRQCAAAAVLLVFMTGMIGVAANNELLYRIWGTHGKENVESHEEIVYETEKGTSNTVVYPAREYTDQNLDKAEELIGSSLTFEPLIKEIGERLSDEEETSERTESLQVPLSTRAEQIQYHNAQGGMIALSPLSMVIDMDRVPGIAKEAADAPWHAYYVSVNYSYGSRYLVHEHGINGIHSCGKDVDNASYTLGTSENQLIFVFNRLIDPQQAESVTVNETTYNPTNTMPD